MIAKSVLKGALVSAVVLTTMPATWWCPAFSQEQTAAPTSPAAQAPEPLSADELEVLVARIALYPDELVAVITGASLYPAADRRGSALPRRLRQGQEPEAEGKLGWQRRSRCSTIPISSR